MAFPLDLTSVLTGATPTQLHRWSATGLLRPELGYRPSLYSFEDLVALRTFVKMRPKTSLQRIRRALRKLKDFDLTEHPARYQLHTDGRSVYFVEDGRSVDLIRKPGQRLLINLEDVFAPFENKQGEQVVNFLRPQPHLEVRETRLGGWPTVENTRVAYDSVAKLVSGEDGIRPEEVAHFYPSVSAEGAVDAKALYDSVVARRRRVA